MTTVNDIYNAINAVAPFSIADSFDNSGILVGSPSSPVSKALLALDITQEVIDEALKKKIDLIITHHPAIFNPLKTIAEGSIAYRLVSNGISHIAAHTNLDKTQSGIGISEIMAKLLEMKITDIVFEKTDIGEGYGKICTLSSPISACELAKRVKQAFQTEVVRYVDGEKPIRSVALCSGSGGSSAKLAAEMGIDAYITGDVKHDQFIDAHNCGLTLIDGGHFYTENIVLDFLKAQLENSVSDVSFEIAKSNKDIVSYL